MAALRAINSGDHAEGTLRLGLAPPTASLSVKIVLMLPSESNPFSSDMAKVHTNYVCQACGAISPRWQGKCESCGAWNTILEETAAAAAVPVAQRTSRKGRSIRLEPLGGVTEEAPRIASGIAEFDRVLGGGFVRGSVVLLGGDPGIGKSTILIEVAAKLAGAGRRVIYVSGEEAIGQVRMRAERLGLAAASIELAAETNVEDIVSTLSGGVLPSLVVIDSIQTMWTEAVESAPGTVTQVRGAAQALLRYAKKSGASVVLVGHVTKDGQIAGPRVVEHMVDAVLSFEGEGNQQFRILRALKNRFGPTDEIGVFEMTGRGLAEVQNPSALFISERDLGSPGTAVFAGMEGTRPLLVEIQALVAATALGTPRRAVVGADANRLSMILAVLEARCGVRLSGHDVYLNVAGGLRILEPAADLAVAAALVSSLSGAKLPQDAVYFGEISLTGAVRAVPQTPARLKEAVKLGFTSAVLPEGARGEAVDGVTLSPIAALDRLVADVAARSPRGLRAAAGRDEA
jgi:DNA repair protein RadA/Sms